MVAVAVVLKYYLPHAPTWNLIRFRAHKFVGICKLFAIHPHTHIRIKFCFSITHPAIILTLHLSQSSFEFGVRGSGFGDTKMDRCSIVENHISWFIWAIRQTESFHMNFVILKIDYSEGRMGTKERNKLISITIVLACVDATVCLSLPHFSNIDKLLTF